MQLAASLDEPDDRNFLKDTGPGARIFGPGPGAYGSGILQLLEQGSWRSDEDLAAVYIAWSGYSYGRSGYGVAGNHLGVNMAYTKFFFVTPVSDGEAIRARLRAAAAVAARGFFNDFEAEGRDAPPHETIQFLVRAAMCRARRFFDAVRQLSAWPAIPPSVQGLEKSQRDANALHPSQAVNPSAAAIARRGGAPAARIERATRSDPAWLGAKAGSQVYLHLADRARSVSHTSAPLSGLGRGAGGRSRRVRAGTPGLL